MLGLEDHVRSGHDCGVGSLRFVLLGLFQWFGGTAWAHAAGREGLELACLALCDVSGLELEDTLRRLVLPLGRHGVGTRVLPGGIGGDLDLVEREAGVREQL